MLLFLPRLFGSPPPPTAPSTPGTYYDLWKMFKKNATSSDVKKSLSKCLDAKRDTPTRLRHLRTVLGEKLVCFRLFWVRSLYFFMFLGWEVYFISRFDIFVFYQFSQLSFLTFTIFCLFGMRSLVFFMFFG